MKKICVYAHYNSENKIAPYVLYCLDKMREEGIRILFVSASRLSLINESRLSNVVEKIIYVPNIGCDFYMWEAGIEYLSNKILEIDSLILLNSSVLGPIFSLQDFFKKMDIKNLDFWGISDSYEIRYHVQSYFLVFNRKVINSEVFRDYWSNLVPLHKDDVIRIYEVQLSKYFNERGFTSDVYYHARDKSNPTLCHPIEMFKAKVPFVKIQLLRDNPCKIKLEEIVNYIKKNGNINIDVLNPYSEVKLNSFDRRVKRMLSFFNFKRGKYNA
ncbi:MAG: hypothetical protein DRP84_08785 [Spirochaetes bacterium]|nr:MAG: hypothetical protein DRP84_08785 [Spirochaetota bacterium]